MSMRDEQHVYYDAAQEWPEDFYQMLELIRLRPGMYTGVSGLQAVKTWLDGFSFARRMAGLPLLQHEQEFAGFDEFVQRRYDWRDTGGWVAKIEYYHRDPEKALEEFFRLLDLFKRESKGEQTETGDLGG